MLNLLIADVHSVIIQKDSEKLFVGTSSEVRLAYSLENTKGS